MTQEKTVYFNNVPVDTELVKHVLKDIQGAKHKHIRKIKSARNEGIRKSSETKLKRLDDFTNLLEYAIMQGGDAAPSN